MDLGAVDPALVYAIPPPKGRPEFDLIPTDQVSIIGFPLGLSAGGRFAVWVTGTIASEMDVNYDDLPIFLVDCKSRAGQSGSPVIAFRSGGMVNLKDGNAVMFNGPVSNFLGIYSGRIHKDSDIGMVWRTATIAELLNSI